MPWWSGTPVHRELLPGCCSTPLASRRTPRPRSTGTTRRRDGRLVAYGVSEGGDERSVLRIIDVATGQHLPDEIPHTRAASVGWLPDGSRFLYTRYPEDSEYGRRVYEHVLGGAWADDRLVWDALVTPESWADVEVSPSGDHALVHVSIGWKRTDVHLYDCATSDWRVVVEGVDERTALGFDGDRLLGFTNIDAPRGRVVTATVEEPSRWETLVAEGEAVIDGVVPAGERFYVLSTEHAVARLAAHDRLDGRATEVSPSTTWAPSPASTPTRRRDWPSCSSSRSPVHRSCAASTARRSTPADAGPADGAVRPTAPAFSVTRTTYRSADGTEVGLFLVHRADLVPTPETPAILTGYGGFAISSTPVWSPLAAAWCERGGLWAVAGPTRWRRGGRGVARGGHARQQAERLRRLRRRRRPSRRRRAHVPQPARPARRFERRAARGHRTDPAAGAGPGRPLRGAAHGHGPVSRSS